VTGEPLDAQAIRVEIPYEVPAKQSCWQRWFPRYFPAEANKMTFTVLVCCPACIAQVKADPSKYYLKVYADRLGESSQGTQAGAAGANHTQVPGVPSTRPTCCGQ